MKKKKDASELREIPGIGPAMERDLKDLGISRVKDLASKQPQKLYDRLCRLRGSSIDRCVLYVFRSAVYYAKNKKRDPELLKWWNWKDRE